MDNESPELPTFQRQRRNVFIVSLVLVFALQTDLTIEKLSFFGNELKTNVPYSAATWLWWLWGYWIIRMVQALLELPQAPVRGQYSQTYQQQLNRVAFNKIVKELNLKVESSPARKDPFLKPGGWTVNRMDRWRVLIVCQFQIEYTDNQGRKITEARETYGAELKGVELVVPKLLSVIYTVFLTTKITEYVFPFIVGLSPVAVWVFNK